MHQESYMTQVKNNSQNSWTWTQSFSGKKNHLGIKFCQKKKNESKERTQEQRRDSWWAWIHRNTEGRLNCG